jgi:hypothetical protein
MSSMNAMVTSMEIPYRAMTRWAADHILRRVEGADPFGTPGWTPSWIIGT